jgi:hypothetical protein
MVGNISNNTSDFMMKSDLFTTLLTGESRRFILVEKPVILVGNSVNLHEAKYRGEAEDIKKSIGREIPSHTRLAFDKDRFLVGAKSEGEILKLNQVKELAARMQLPTHLEEVDLIGFIQALCDTRYFYLGNSVLHRASQLYSGMLAPFLFDDIDKFFSFPVNELEVLAFAKVYSESKIAWSNVERDLGKKDFGEEWASNYMRNR